VSTIDQTVFIL